MPIYEYKCTKCGKEFELFQRITAPDVKNCKFCKGPVSKLISLSSFSLKGTGWYATDYGGKKPTADEKKKEDSAASTPSESTSKTDSKTE